MHGTKLKRGVKLSSTPLLLFVAAFSVLGSIILFQARADSLHTYYVATTGSDANDGSAAKPWQTLQRSLSKLSPGDTLVVRGGTYAEQIQDPPIRPGTANGRITVKAAAGERPVVSGLLWLTDADFWTIDGVNVTWNTANTPDQYMVRLANGTGWRLTHSEVWGAKSYAAIMVAGAAADWSIDHNYIHDTFTSNGPSQDHLVYVTSGMGGGAITRNVIANSPNGRGIKLGPQASGSESVGNVKVSYNTLYNNTGPSNIQLSYGATGNQIFNNLFVKSADQNVTAYELTGSGNTVYDNAGWDSTGIVEPVAGLDEHGNIRLDPGLDVATFAVKNSAAGNYGRFAAGDADTDTALPMPAITDDHDQPTAPAGARTSLRTGTAVEVSWDAATDDMGVSGYIVYRNGTDPGVRVGAVTQYIDAGLQTGMTYTYQIAAVDAAGNISPKTAPVHITTATASQPEDTAAPSIRLTSPAPGATVRGPTTVEASAADSHGVNRVEFSIDGVVVMTDDTSPYQYAWDSGAVVGDHTVQVRAIDAAGNASTAWTVVNTGAPPADAAPPAAPIEVAAAASGTGQINVTWKAPGADRVDVYRNDQYVGSVRSAAGYGDTYRVRAGKTYSYYLVARDKAGLASPRSAVVLATTADVQQQGPWSKGLLTGRITSDTGQPVAGAKVSVQVSGKTMTAVSNKQGVYTLNGTPAATYQISVSAAGFRTQTQHIITPSTTYKIMNITVGK